MLLQVTIAIASSLALILALLLRTGMGTSRDFSGHESSPAEQVVDFAAEEPGALFVPPAGMRAAAPHPIGHSETVAAQRCAPVAPQGPAPSAPHRQAASVRSPEFVEPARQRLRIGAVCLDVPEGQEVTVMQDDSGALTVMIQPPLAAPAQTIAQPAEPASAARTPPEPRERAGMARAFETVAA